MELLTERPDYARLHDYFGIWMMHEETFAGMFQHVAATPLAAHVAAAAAQPQAAAPASAAPRLGDIAVIDIRGSMMKANSSMSASTSTVRVRQQLRQAVRDVDVSQILLVIDSPGGTVAGTEALAADVRDANKVKPVVAYVEDLGASAAMWVASQAGQIFTHDSAQVGSIGTFMVVEDRSQMAEQLGIKVHVIRAGAFKGAGVPGTEVTAEQLANWQQKVDQLNELFLQSVAAGRRMSIEKVKSLADGRTHVGQDALQLGLVDGVQSLDVTLAQMREKSAKSSRPKAETMTLQTAAPAESLAPAAAAATPLIGQPLIGQTLAPRAATLAELKAACPGASAEFLMGQLEAGAVVSAAQTAFTLHLQQQLAAAQARPAAPAPPARPGNKPLGTAGTGAVAETVADGNPVDQFHQLVSERMAAGVERGRAILQVAKANPDLHTSYLLATNTNKAAQRLISEKVG